MDEFKELQYKIRDILDRNNFVNQKIDLSTLKNMNNVKVQDAFRIRVLQPLRFSVEIVKPLPMKDFLFVAGRLNISPEHQKIIHNLQLTQKIELFEDIKLELTKRKSNFKFAEDPATKQIGGLECMMSVYISSNEETLAKDLFSVMDEINKSFFLFIVMLQGYLRKAGFDEKSVGADATPASSMYQ